MANQKLTDLTQATTPLSGTEQVYVVQSSTSKRTTAQQLANLAPGTDLSYTAATRVLASSTGADATLPVATTSDAGLLSAADKTKLDGVAAGATANSSDATLLNRANHTGTQAAGTITGLATVATSGSYADLSNKPSLGTAAAANTGTAAGNVVVLDGSARLPAVDGSQLTGINATTDLGYTASTRVLTSSTGADVTLPEATTSEPGLMAAADKTKLDGIAAGAEVNVNADWNAGSGDAQILNKPTLGSLAALSTVSDAEIAANAEIAVSKLADGAARQLLQTDAAGTGVEWTSNVDIPGTLDVTQAATFDSTLSFPLGAVGTPSIYPGSDSNTGFWSPAADTLAISTNGVERVRVGNTETKLTNDLNLDDGGSFTTTLQTITPTANRTLSLPDATGTVALVAGSSGSVIINSSGAYAGDAGLTYSTTNRALTLGGATVTTSNPVLDITQTWNAGAVAFTGARFNFTNTASAAGSLLADFQLGGTSQLGIGREGHLVPVSNALEVRNSTTAQSFRVYNTFTSSTSFERARLEWSSNVLILGPERGSAGGSVREFSIRGALGVGTDQAGGNVTIRGGQGTGTGAGGMIVFETTPSSTTGSTANTSTERLRVSGNGTISYNQAAPVTVDASATVTVANLQVGLLTSDAAPSTPVTITLPTGTNMDGGFASPYVNQTFEWSVINLDGTEAVTIAGNTAHTLVGSATVAANVSARWASRRTAANTWVSYRIS